MEWLIVAGVILLLLFFDAKLTGIRFVPNNRIGLIEKRWSGRGSIKGGFIALNGEAGFLWITKMPLGWRKSVKLLPGIKANFNLNSFGLTLGGKRARITTNTRRGTRASLNLPFGFSYWKSLNATKKRRRR